MKDESVAWLRSAALVAVVLGALGSIGLLRHAQQHPPPFLILLFIVWVSAPFVILGGANVLSPRWPAAVGKTLHIVTIFIAVASLAIYFDDNVAHRTAKPAFVYVATPPVSVLLSSVAVGAVSLIEKRKARSRD